MSNVIQHKGTIHSVDGQMVRVRIVQRSACASCKVAAQCTAAESKEKIVDVLTDNAANYTTGQEVTVQADTSVGMKAVLIAFVIPIVIMMAVIITTLRLTDNELMAALCGLAVLIPYYIILFFCRNKLRNILTFSIKE